MKALIVGAGAVGQVFGRHLARGGAEVTFLVKPKYADECRRGFTLYQLRKTEPVRLDGCGVVTEASAGFDQVYLTVSSPALHGDWLPALGRATGDATIVKLQPGLTDRAIVAAAIAPERIVGGTINFLSYHAPLPGETRFAEPGMAYWLFPGKAPFSGDDARVRAVVAALRAGGLPARRVRDVERTAAYPSAVLCAFVCALEAAGWSFRAMRRSIDGPGTAGHAALGTRAGREAVAIVARELDTRPPLSARAMTRLFAFAMLRVAPRVVPCDFETYLRVHFTKVGDQMHAGLADYLARGKRAGQDVGALDELVRQLPALTPAS